MYSLRSERGTILDTADGEIVAFVPADDTREIDNGIIAEVLSPKAWANAALIAAAPDLLAALEEILELFEINVTRVKAFPFGEQSVLKARAAIAKARGDK